MAFLRARGHAVELYRPARFDACDAVVFSKAYGARDIQLARRLKAAGKRVILDLCDDHFHNPERLPKYEAEPAQTDRHDSPGRRGGLLHPRARRGGAARSEAGYDAGHCPGRL